MASPQADNGGNADPELEFAARESVLYANHAAISPWPRSASRAAAAFAQENEERGPLHYSAWLEREAALRERVARLINAPAALDIALLANTSEGISTVAEGIAWRPGDNVVTPRDEFVANRVPWENLRDRGVELRCVDIRAAPDAEAALADRMDARTRILAVSAVQWTDGFRLNLDRLGKSCRDRGAWLFVDAIQQLGALRMDVRAGPVDFLAAGSHKWQMGPEGMGVFYCREPLRDELALHRHGWRSLEEPYRFDVPDRPGSRSARRFEPGSPNMLGQAVLHASLGVLESIGPAEVERRVLDNSRRLVSHLSGIPGFEVVSRTEPHRLSGIVSFASRRVPARALHRELKKLGVVCAHRGDAIRLSPHYYQNGAWLERLAEALEEAARK